MANVGHMFVRGRRMAGVWAVAAVALALTTACTPAPGPQPSPSPTGFASEEEAFAAAEETYRAYVDALNQVDLSDPETFEPVYALTTGNFHEDERKLFSEYHAEGYVVSGESTVALVEPLTWEKNVQTATLAACVDVSEVELVDSEGKSLVSPDRVDIQSTLVTLTASSTSTDWLIRDIEGRAGEPTCAN